MTRGSVQGLDEDLDPPTSRHLQDGVGPEAEGSGSRRAARLPVPVHQPFMSAPTRGKVQAALFYGWKAGSNSVYYLRTKPAGCTALHDPRPRRSGRREGQTILCCVLGVRGSTEHSTRNQQILGCFCDQCLGPGCRVAGRSNLAPRFAVLGAAAMRQQRNCHVTISRHYRRYRRPSYSILILSVKL
jgi:hypothetical protein